MSLSTASEMPPRTNLPYGGLREAVGAVSRRPGYVMLDGTGIGWAKYYEAMGMADTGETEDIPPTLMRGNDVAETGGTFPIFDIPPQALMRGGCIFEAPRQELAKPHGFPAKKRKATAEPPTCSRLEYDDGRPILPTGCSLWQLADGLETVWSEEYVNSRRQ